MEETLLTKLNRHYKTLMDERDQFVPLWKEISQFCAPFHGRFNDEKKWSGEKTYDKIINDCVVRSRGILQAGMQGGLTPHTRRWFKFGLQDEELAEFGPVRAWLDKFEKAHYYILSKCNFYGNQLKSYDEQATFGQSCTLKADDPENLISWSTLTAGRYAFGVSSTDRVDTLARSFYMTARQMTERFGEENLSTAVKSSLQKDGSEYFQIRHIVRPAKGYDSRKWDQYNFESIYWEASGDNDKLLRKKGFKGHFPVVAPRWATVESNDPYGFSPCMRALGSVKQLQATEKTETRAIHLAVEPPMRIPSAYKGRLSLLPGAKNKMTAQENESVKPLFDFRPDISNTTAKIKEIERRIERSLYTDLFLMILEDGRSNITAFEINEKINEKHQTLGPTIERELYESLDPALDIVSDAIIAAGFAEQNPPPPEIREMDLKVDYISILAQAQKMQGMQSMYAFLEFGERLAALRPNALNKMDEQEMMDQAGSMTGVPPKVLRSDDEVAEIEAAQAEQAQKEEQMAQMAQVPGAVKDLAAAKTQDPSALTELMAAMGGET